ncbi:MAG: hypothetical protein PVF45_02585 [Anaerolineae bacterium]
MNNRKLFSIQTLLWLALVLALVGSLRHVAWGFASLEGGDMIMGYVQAIAIDVGLLALALAIQTRKRQRRATRALWAGVALFSFVSTYANLLHGLAHQADIGLSGYEWLVSLRPILLSGVLPALVLYLSEIVGDDVNYAVKQAKKEERKQERERQKDASTVKVSSSVDTLATARATRKAQAEQAVSALVAFYSDNPLATQTQAGAAVGRSRQWVSSQLTRLEREGVISRNGNGVEVADDRAT